MERGASPQAEIGPRARSWLDRAALPLTLAIAGLVLLPALGGSGIWDPHELDAVELSRRIAVAVFGRRDLALDGAANELPTLTDLRMGELPFTSMAVGLSVFGLEDWAGRVPLAAWACGGVVALYALLARLVAPRAGLYAATTLACTPLYFMQARTMLGDAVTLASFVLAFAGLAGAAFDTRGPTAGRRLAARIAWGFVGALGLVAGALTRGLLVGAAVPALAVGVAWIALVGGAGSADPSSIEAGPPSAAARLGVGGHALGALALVVGLGAALVGALLLSTSTPEQGVRRLLGLTLLRKTPAEATFDLPLRNLGHGLGPLAALVPFAAARLLRASPRDRGPGAVGLRFALLAAGGLGIAAAAFVAPAAGSVVVPSCAAFAGIIGLALFDLDEGDAPSRTLALGIALLGAVFAFDALAAPETMFRVFLVDRPSLPKADDDAARPLVLAAFGGFTVLSALAFAERSPPELDAGVRGVGPLLRRRVADVRTLGREVATAFGGNLLFVAIVVEAALVGLGAMLFAGGRLHLPAVERLPQHLVHFGLRAFWVVPLGVLLAVPATYALRDATSALPMLLRVPRGALVGLGALLVGGCLGFGYYPAIAARLSPKGAFDTYERLGAGQPLGLVGVRPRAASYYRAGEVHAFGDVASALPWLVPEPPPTDGARRWLVARRDDLPRLNSLHRKLRGRNLPVLDARAGSIVLASSDLGGRPNDNPLGAILPDAPVVPAIPVAARFQDQLEVLGWEVRDEDGAVIAEVVPQTPYRIRFYYRVLDVIPGNWKAFLHIDGRQRRFNGDHVPTDGVYPMSLWQPGDVVIDEVPLELEPNFTPGEYGVYFGFFAGESRFHVASGASDDDRVIGGVLRVR